MKVLNNFPVFIVLSIFTGCKSTTSRNDLAAAIPPHPLEDVQDLDILIDRIGDSRIVLLGEASHGTAEYYDWRSEFGSCKGTVIASDSWGGEVETMRLPPAKKKVGKIYCRGGAKDKIVFSDEIWKIPELMEKIGRRAIGVQYNPNFERGNYLPMIIPERYDVFVYIDESTALRPLGVEACPEPPDTYPSGF